METELSSLDVIFLSYDEENADENWSDLVNKVPWAKRVHGVKGSDAAHKAAAKLSETERFISVDADNKIDPLFFDLSFNFDDEKFKGKALSWSAKNAINGLEYGNGGLKCWPVQYVLDMKTHEAAENDKNQVDFCWEDGYLQMNNIYSTTYNNASPRMAFRAGFREGVKMSLNQGLKVEPKNFEQKIWRGNYQRLLIWSTIGADVENGLWAVYGTRLGCYMATLTDWDFIKVRDFEYINSLWKEQIAPKFVGDDSFCFRSNYRWNNNNLLQEIQTLGNTLRKELSLPVAEMDSNQSKFFKRTYVSLPRLGKYITEVDMLEIRKKSGISV